MTEKKWLVHDEAVDRGPYSNKELRQLVQELRVVQSTKISRIDDEEICYEARQIKGLFLTGNDKKQTDVKTGPEPPAPPPSPNQGLPVAAINQLLNMPLIKNNRYKPRLIAGICLALAISLLALTGLLWPTIRLLVSLFAVISLSATAYFAFHWFRNSDDSEKTNGFKANSTRAIVGAFASIFFLVIYGLTPKGAEMSIRVESKSTVKPDSVDSVDFDKVKKQTIIAWQALNAANQEFFSAKYPSDSSRFSQQAFLLSQSSLEDVDPALQKHILARVDQYRRSAVLWSEIEMKFAELQRQTQSATEFGGLLVAMAGDERNTRRDAAAAAAVFGLIGKSFKDDRVKKILGQYAETLNAHKIEYEKLAKDRINLAGGLEEKYRVPFVIPN